MLLAAKLDLKVSINDMINIGISINIENFVFYYF